MRPSTAQNSNDAHARATSTTDARAPTQRGTRPLQLIVRTTVDSASHDAGIDTAEPSLRRSIASAGGEAGLSRCSGRRSPTPRPLSGGMVLGRCRAAGYTLEGRCSTRLATDMRNGDATRWAARLPRRPGSGLDPTRSPAFRSRDAAFLDRRRRVRRKG